MSPKPTRPNDPGNALPAVARQLLAGLLMALACLIGLQEARAASAAVGPQIDSKAWWIDASGQASLAQVLGEARWTEYTNVKSFGFGDETIWIRLRIRGEDPAPGTHWVMRVHPAFTDDVTLHDPTHGLTLRAGRAIPLNDQTLSSIVFSFRIPAQAEARDVFVQARSVSSRSLRIELLPQVQAERVSRLEEWLLGAAITLSAVFALWALTQWIWTREPVIGAFALKQAVAALFSFFFLGFARISIGPLLPPGALTLLGSLLAVALAAAVTWFMVNLLAPYRPQRHLLMGLRVLVVAYAVLPTLMLAGMTQDMLWVTNMGATAGLLLLMVTALSALKSKSDQPVPLPWLIAYLFVFVLLNTTQVLIHLGVISSSSSVMIGTVTTTITDGLVMFFILQFRGRELRKRQQATEMELLRSREQTEAEKRQREEQGRLFAMLAHEMKTPLATLRLWLGSSTQHRERMDHTITEMNQIIERCVQAGQLADQSLNLEVIDLDAIDLTQRCIEVCPDPAGMQLSCSAQTAPLQTDLQVASIILSNLLDNACKYRAAGTPVHLELRAQARGAQEGWLWRIENQAGATGLPDPERLFEKYYRNPKARRQSGSGLGLYLVHGLLTLLQGKIDYETRDGRAVFSIWLPTRTGAISSR